MIEIEQLRGRLRHAQEIAQGRSATHVILSPGDVRLMVALLAELVRYRALHAMAVAEATAHGEAIDCILRSNR
jgi:hypothetical protein